MDIIQLPMVPALTPPRAALAIMFAAHRSAVVTAREHELVLASAADVRLAINQKLRAVVEIGGLETIPELQVEIPGGVPPPIVSPLGLPHRRIDASYFGIQFANPLSQVSGDYAVIRQAAATAYVLTRYETRAELYADPPQRCACGNPNFLHEYGESADLHTGDPCPRCSFTITCG